MKEGQANRDEKSPVLGRNGVGNSLLTEHRGVGAADGGEKIAGYAS